MSELERCPSCAAAREKEEWLSAANCHACEGKGFRRVPTSFTCNRCGGSMCPEGAANADCPHGLVEARVSGGYDSYHLFDGTTYRFSLCEKCLRELFATFKVKPDVFDYIGGRNEDFCYADDERSYQIRVWQKAEGHIQKLTTGLCNATPECAEPATLRHFVSGYMTDEAYCPTHADGHTFGNSRWVSEELCRGIPLKAEDRDELQKQRVIEAYTSTLAAKRLTHIRYVSEAVRDVVGCPEETGAIWLPTAVAEPAWLTEALAARQVTALVLTTGRLYYGEHDVVRGLAARKFDEVEAAI